MAARWKAAAEPNEPIPVIDVVLSSKVIDASEVPFE